MSHKDAPPAELSVFLVTPASNLSGPAADLSDINGVSCRKRKKHTKSHLGCAACKKRRVKCDNVSPACGSCARRGEKCSLSKPPQAPETLSITSAATSKKREQPLGQPVSGLTPVGLDALQVHLLDNFVKNTLPTLPFGGDIWHGDMAVLALEHDYLMHAVLLISARHLSYLSPNSLAYRRASLFHLSKTLPRYREEVSKPLSNENADFAMAATFLMLYYIWTDVDTFDILDDACFINDQLFAMTGGLRETFISAIHVVSSGRSIFSETIANRPGFVVEKVALGCSQPPAHFYKLFFEEYYARGGDGIMNIPDDSGEKIPEFSDIRGEGKKVDNNDLWYSVIGSHDSSLIGFLDASVRLAPLCSVSSELDSSPGDWHLRVAMAPRSETSSKSDFANSLPMVDLARYVYTWPNGSSPGILDLLARKDERMILLLYYFYQTIKAILPKQYWWAHQRAEKMIPIFEESFTEQLRSFQSRPQAVTIPQDVIVRATNFATQANKSWRHYCILYGLEAKVRTTEDDQWARRW